MRLTTTRVFPLFLLFILSFGAAGALFADDDPDDLLRFPTLLKVKYDASPNTGSVVISFEGVGGSSIDEKNTLYRIYRASSPIMSLQSLYHAEMAAEVPIEEIPFRDNPEQDGMYYYAVLSVIEGEEQQFIVPYQNATVSAIDFAPLPGGIEAFKITQQEGTRISLSFTPLNPEYTYNLYISMKAIEDIGDLLPGEKVRGKGSFDFSVREDIPYFFAITSVNRLGAENRKLSPGRNVNVDPFEIKTAAKIEVKKAWVKKKQPAVQSKPAIKKIAPIELIDRNLRNHFYKGEYAEALEVFDSILTNEHLSPGEKSAVHFYMGQCEFYLGEYKKAIRSFILSKEDPGRRGQAESWIDRCLERVN